MTLALIALRNLDRNRRRTALSLLVAASGATALILTAGFVRFSFEGLRVAIVEGGLGHLEVALKGDFEGSPSSLERSSGPPALADWQRLREEIERRPYVAAAGGTIQFAGMATHGDRSAAFVAMAVEPDRELRMGVSARVRRGQGLADAAPKEGDDEVLLGVGLARVLQVAPGESIALVTLNSEGSLDAMDVTVRGLITTGLQELDARVLKTHVVTAQRLLGTASVSSIIVGLDDADHTAVAQADLQSRFRPGFPSLTVLSWEERAPFYRQVRSLYGAIFVFLGGVVFLLVALSSSNTLLMSVLERVREFGTLRAIGTSKGQVGTLVVLESLWLGLISGIVGAVLGQALALLINHLKLRMPPPPGATDPLDLTLRVQPFDLVAVVVFMVLLLGFAALLPTLRVVRLSIAHALAHD